MSINLMKQVETKPAAERSSCPGLLAFSIVVVVVVVVSSPKLHSACFVLACWKS